MPKAVDYSGSRFGKLKVVKKMPRKKYEKSKYYCICDCGNTSIISSSNLVTGHAKSCGCIVKKHGYARKERLYNIWVGMKQRCRDKNDKDYSRYGGRGITVCTEWLDDYLMFRKWAMSSGYTDNSTIDRINVDGNYEPSNCRWETIVNQQKNKTNNKLITYNGKTLSVTEWAREININEDTFKARILRGWSIEKAINTPISKRGDTD